MLQKQHKLFHGDCLDVLKNDIPDNSIDALVTDPPAGISFMGKSWDDDKGGSQQWIEWLTEVMVEVKRTMKPGAHGFVWALPRTSHWTAMALEKAGFEIRDVVVYLFGSGFPKSHDISKAIDREAGVEREIIGKLFRPIKGTENHNGIKSYNRKDEFDLTIPKLPESNQWNGWGTALKPASEHWILVRKPLSEKTVAKNVLRWGVGGLNIDGSRIGNETLTYQQVSSMGASGTFSGQGASRKNGGLVSRGDKTVNGRFPANLILSHNHDCVEIGMKEVGSGDFKKSGTRNLNGPSNSMNSFNQKIKNAPDNYGTETVQAFECTEGCAVAALDEQSGERPVSGSAKLGKPHEGDFKKGFLNKSGQRSQRLSPNDSGGASRFFYCAKPSKREKNEGCDKNHHPTVKPVKLMSYLIKMITPPGGVVLDPFGGSGTTAVAARLCGFSSILIEREADYCEIISARTK